MTDVLARLTTSLADRYRIERELGQGGMATVYLAHDVRHQRKVALKVLRPELAAILGGERFLQEIRTTANLQHPHILPLHDSGEVDGVVYYVMPFVEGESLRDKMNREKQLPVDESVRIAREVADALEYAHQHGVVHRDIKPENILIHGGHAMVADFGIALAVSTVGGGTRMTETGMSLGTPHYMAPEQAMGDREITPRADIYALGCVLYEMLTGDPPFTGSTAQAIVARVVTESPRPLTAQRQTIPPHVEAVTLRALEKLPADRFASAGEFLAALDNPAFAHGARGHAGTGAPARGSSRIRALAPLGVAAVAVVFAATGWMRSPPVATPPVVRYSVSPAREGAVRLGMMTLSDDGRVLVYAGSDSNRLNRLYVRYADREEPVLIRDVGLATAPFLSPDGRGLGIAQDGRLAWMPLEGGLVSAITDLSGAAFVGASWGPDSTIVYADAGSLWRIHVNGSGRELLLEQDTVAGERYGQPKHTLDGSAVVLALMGRPGSAAEPRLAAMSLRDRRVRPLGIQGRLPHVANGLLVYTDASGTVFSVPFDEDRLEVRGTPAPVLDGVVTGGQIALLAVSRNGSIAWIGTGAATAGREVTLVNRQGRTQPLPVPPLGWRHPRFSPDGRRLVIGSEYRGSRGDLWVYEFASRRMSRLTFDSLNVHPVWSPDGRYILFPSLRGQRNTLYRVLADGSSSPESVLARPRSIWEAELTPDGRTLVFREDEGGANRNIYLAPADSPAAVRGVLTSPLDERTIAISPDGRWLAYVSNASGGNGVYLRRLDTVSAQWPVSTGAGIEPRWSRSGRELFYRSNDSLYAVPITLGPEPRIGQPRVLFGGRFEGSVYHSYYDVSPDGRTFVFVRSRDQAAGLAVRVAMNLIQPR